MEYTPGKLDVNVDAAGLVVDVDSLYVALSRLADRRAKRGVRYALVTVLVLVVLAKLSGEDRLSGIAEWVRHRAAVLAEALHWVKVRVPHRTTYSRILAHAVDIREFEQVTSQFFAQQTNAGRSIVVSLDGKTLRGTIAAGQSQGLHLLAAFLPDEGWVLMQVEVEGQENEVSAAPRLLRCLDLRGKVVTGDAMLAQRHLSAHIVEAGGEYLWTVKENQPELHRDISTLFEPEKCVKGFSPALKDFRMAQSVEKGHGRIEQRTITVSSELKGYLNWPYAEQVFKLERHTQRVKEGKITQDLVYGVTSLRAHKAGAQQLLQWTRKHWQIENGLYYRRDETLREDWCHLRMGQAPHAMAIINNLVLGLLLRRGVRNVPQARRYHAAHMNEALQLILRC
jgi:predicted transposase YbfD/YdcC